MWLRVVGELLGNAFEFQEFEIGGAGRHHHLGEPLRSPRAKIK
jgi:hypothetical protein